MIITQRDFCEYVEDNFINNNKTMIEIVLEACEKYNIDPELISPLINRSVKEKLKIEYINLNYLEKENISLF